MSCIICNHDSLTTLWALPEFPISMGCTERPVKGETETLDYCYCDSCLQLQIRNKIPLDKLYSSNHNTEVVGTLWKDHFREFAQMLIYNDIHGEVLEIGDPACKVARYCSAFADKWTIVEPNFDGESGKNLLNVHVAECLFEDFATAKQYDFIIHSHLLEHQYQPKAFLQKCYDLLKPEGFMFFSVPDMGSIKKTDFLPTSIMNFEHIYYLDMGCLDDWCQEAGFVNIRNKYFNNHSVFAGYQKRLQKPMCHTNCKVILDDFRDNLVKTQQYLQDLDKKIVSHINNGKKVYAFGSHVKTQLILHQSAHTKHLSGLLDNSASKHGKYLYGYGLPIFASEVIYGVTYQPVVITSHMSIYRKEIEEQLLKINPTVIFI